MFGLIKKVFVVLLSFVGSIAFVANVSDFTKCIFVNNEPSLTGLNSNGLHYYPFNV